MAHKVTFLLPRRPLGFSDIVIVIKRGTAMFGELRVSQGAVVWRPAWQPPRGKAVRKMNWKQFAKAMDDSGKPLRRRRS